MTCLIGLVEDGKVYMGGDSAAVTGYDTRQAKAPKVFENGEFLMGYTTSFRMGQLLQYHLTIPKQTSHESDMSYMVTTFIDAVRDCFKNQGFTTINNNT